MGLRVRLPARHFLVDISEEARGLLVVLAGHLRSAFAILLLIVELVHE